MVKLKKEDIEKKLVELGLNKSQIDIFYTYVHEKYLFDAIKIYKNLNIVKNTADSIDTFFALIKPKDKSYDVNLEVINEEFVSFCSCTNRVSEKACEHIGAALLYKLLQKKINYFSSKLKVQKKSTSDKIDNDLDYFKNLFPKKEKGGQKSMIYFNFEDFDNQTQSLKIERGVIKKDGGYGYPAKFNAKNFDALKWQISKSVRKVLTYINNTENSEIGYYISGLSKNRFYDIGTDLMMPVLKDIYFEEKEIILGATFSQDNFKIVWNIIKNKEDKYLLEPFFVSGKKKTSLLNMNLFEIGSTTLWVFENNKRCFYKYKNSENLDLIRQIIKLPKKIELNEKELKEFFSKYYQKILDNFEFNLSGELKIESKSTIPKPKLYLEKFGQNIKINLKFDYLGREIDYFSKSKEVVIIENDVIYEISRDLEREEEIVDILNDNAVVIHDTKDEFILDEDLVDFVSIQIQRIINSGIDVLGEDKLFNFKIVKKYPKLNLKVKSEKDWFDISGDIKFGSQVVNIHDVLDAIFENKRFVELSNGKSAVIPKKWIENLKGYSEFFDLENKKSKLSKYHLSIINSLIELSANVNLDSNVKKIINNLKNFEKIKQIPLSKNVNANLRNYQKIGYDWLCFLHEFGFNGILADDMGLGKTLQTLSLLQKLKDEKKNSSFLVVVPTSLIFNWKEEIKKFTPNLDVYTHHGQNRINVKNKNSTAKFNEKVKKSDLIITTYGVLRNDLKLFSEIEFDYIVLDEAQTIKNHFSVSAKSAYLLKGKNRLVISGTPIQNNLMELWSLFQFLNPGYLGGYEFFRENFVLPIERDHDKNISNLLKKLINPFILRRTKNIISDELPEKTEMILKCSFSKEETDIYDTWKDYYKHEIKNKIKEKGIGNSRMKILEGLMKLRQICLHPRMIDPKYSGGSAKFDLLMIEIEKLLKEGHKVLVFSSFVKMLSIVKDEFEKKGLKFSYLDGKTKNSEKIVKNFQESSFAQSFLISIKAGGLGLNLTGAGYVFILDPWWNPAVEMQAMDRAHRIGQDKKVFVYKMICENTIEEKILKLQESKKKLVKDLMVDDGSVIKDINVKDIEEMFG
ncbi:hypothetical protein CMI39_00320 [Candidatus Pacearchaeota archaeon]|jgi:non-specific serine/threonine protein kinase|nr:hypothetical protein [Candidatus Pacearchaeota archaeon]|tara:strand:+ start:128 stop:3373 length:3246 start_codon:yes stop_codon:yes gene_type:complete